ncbi:MAG: prepilin peptidase [Planctomycetaceae bacterium]|nr:prepilin peptidase [Planctomycetaceae bacterium]
MNTILALPIELRLIVLFGLGACVGSVVNWAAYSLCYFHPRPVSPWSRGYPRTGAALWLDRLPLFGWLCERPSGKVFAENGWLRPFVVELLLGLSFAGLYIWEIQQRTLSFLPVEIVAGGALQPLLHWQYFTHVVLLGLMFAVSLIDLDEKTIPDSLTIPGTLTGLTFAAISGQAALGDTITANASTWLQLPLQIVAPNPWWPELDGPWGLATGLFVMFVWCVALLPRTWYGRHGWRRAMQLCVARIVREPVTWRIAAMAVVVELAVAFVWSRGGDSWQAFLSAIVGLGAGGAMVWAIRVMGSLALGREAMGFGDVILLAMIGAFLGWQPVLFAFFLAPFGGLVMGLFNYFSRGEHDLPYGPFLCCGAALTVLNWPSIWTWARPIFEFTLLVPGALAVCLVLCGLLLRVIRVVRGY